MSLLLLAGTVTVLPDDTTEPATVATTPSTDRPSSEPTSASPKSTPTQDATVTTILSGDTIVVLHKDEEVTVRVIGIDAPEVTGSTAGQQCWATESTQFASDALLQQEVRLTADPTQGGVDAAGATLAYVLLPDGRDFSVVSVGAGQARSYTDTAPPTKSAEIAAAEQAARTAALGLWGEPCNGGLSVPAPTTEPAPTTPPPPPLPLTDPRFDNCRQVRAAGYGPYVLGSDPEYFWYPDRDGDGVNCERFRDG